MHRSLSPPLTRPIYPLRPRRYTALAQLISRVVHPHSSVSRRVEHLLTKILVAYPRQAMWTVNALCCSKCHARQDAGERVVLAARDKVQKREKEARQRGAGPSPGLSELDVLLRAKALFEDLISLAERNSAESSFNISSCITYAKGSRETAVRIAPSRPTRSRPRVSRATRALET